MFEYEMPFGCWQKRQGRTDQGSLLDVPDGELGLAPIV